jgi:hypothetical protein
MQVENQWSDFAQISDHAAGFTPYAMTELFA